MDLFVRRLQDLNTRSGSNPLITFYDETTGERTELSVQSFSNWVEKTANLLGDELLAEPGSPVLLTLAEESPGHWMTLIWVAAAWRYGCPVAVGAASDAAVEVLGPTTLDRDGGADERVACSLHPLGLGFTDPLPPGVLDFGIEVRAHGDHFSGPAPAPDAPAWIDARQTRSHADVAATASSADRRLIVGDATDDPWSTIREALVRPVLGGGSAVIVLGATEARRGTIADTERVT